MNRVALVFLGFLIFTLSGCGVTLGAQRVSNDTGTTTTPDKIPGEGIVYALPKTDFELVQAISISIPTSGALQGMFEKCSRACTATQGAVSDDSCNFSKQSKLDIASPQIRTIAVPDPTRLYQISPEAEIFQSLDFKFDILQNGILDKADTSSSNNTYELISNIATSAVKIGLASAKVAAGSPFTKGSLLSKHSTTARSCYQVSNDVANLVQNESGTLSCGLAKEIQVCLNQYDRDISKEQAAFEQIFNNAITNKVNPQLLSLLSEERRQRIQNAITKRNEVATLYELNEGKPKSASYQVVISISGPEEHKAEKQLKKLADEVTGGTAKIFATSENGSELFPRMVTAIKDEKRQYILEVSPPSYLKISKEDENLVLGHGYRYRVPVAAPVNIKVFPDDQGSNPIFSHTEMLQIAQYGSIASLPSKFKGKGGRVAVKHWADTGGLQTVEIGAEPIPTSAVKDVLDEGSNQYIARREKAETSDPELESLTRQQKILTLRKQIEELQDSLKK